MGDNGLKGNEYRGIPGRINEIQEGIENNGHGLLSFEEKFELLKKC